jgi:8-oxo-dGTP diphosphatase
MLERVRVVAGAVFDAVGRVLIAERPAGKHLAGRWEFPGGKIGAGESHEQALARELHEELGISVGASVPVVSVVHAYPDREVELHLHVVQDWDGTARGLDGQRLKWVPLAELGAQDMLEADRPFVDALQRRGPPPRTIRRGTAAAAAGG